MLRVCKLGSRRIGNASMPDLTSCFDTKRFHKSNASKCAWPHEALLSF